MKQVKKSTSEEINEIICFTDPAHIHARKEGSKKATDSNSLRLEFESFLAEDKDGGKKEPEEPKFNEKKNVFPSEEFRRHDSFEVKFASKGNSTIVIPEMERSNNENYKEKRNIFSDIKKSDIQKAKTPINEEDEEDKISSIYSNRQEICHHKQGKFCNPKKYNEVNTKIKLPDTLKVFRKTPTSHPSENPKNPHAPTLLIRKHLHDNDNEFSFLKTSPIADRLYCDFIRKISDRSLEPRDMQTQEKSSKTLFLLLSYIATSPISFLTRMSHFLNLISSFIILFFFPISFSLSVPIPNALLISLMFALGLSICLHLLQKHMRTLSKQSDFLIGKDMWTPIFFQILGLSYLVITWLLTFEASSHSTNIKVILMEFTLVFLPIMKKSILKLEACSSSIYKFNKSNEISFFITYILKTMLILHLLSLTWYAILLSEAKPEEIFPAGLSSSIYSTYIQIFINFGYNVFFSKVPDLSNPQKKFARELDIFRWMTGFIGLYLLCYNIGGMVFFIKRKSKATKSIENTITNLVNYLQKAGVKEHLINEVRNSCFSSLTLENEYKQKSINLDTINSHLTPLKLKTKLLKELYLESIKRCLPLANNFEYKTLKRIAERIKQLTVIKQCDDINLSDSLYIITKGRVIEHVSMGKYKITVNVYLPGDFFNLRPYFSGIMTSTLYQADCYTELLEANRGDLLDILRLSQRDFETMAVLRDKIIMGELEKGWIKNECKFCEDDTIHEAWICPKLRFTPNKMNLFSALRNKAFFQKIVKFKRSKRKFNALKNQKKTEKETKNIRWTTYESKTLHMNMTQKDEEIALGEDQDGESNEMRINCEMDFATVKDFNRSLTHSNSSFSSISKKKPKLIMTKPSRSQSSIMDRSEIEFGVPTLNTKFSSVRTINHIRTVEMLPNSNPKTPSKTKLSKSISNSFKEKEFQERESLKPIGFEPHSKINDAELKFPTRVHKEERQKLHLCDDCLCTLLLHSPKLNLALKGTLNAVNNTASNEEPPVLNIRQQIDDRLLNMEKLLEHEWEEGNPQGLENSNFSRDFLTSASKENKTLEDFKRKMQGNLSESNFLPFHHISIDAHNSFEFYKPESNLKNILLVLIKEQKNKKRNSQKKSLKESYIILNEKSLSEKRPAKKPHDQTKNREKRENSFKSKLNKFFFGFF